MSKFNRPLSPHLTLYVSQLTSTFPISNRISGAFLATIVLFFYLLCLKMGFLCLTYENFYQCSYISGKFIPSAVGLTILALSYHLFYGISHLLKPYFDRYKIRARNANNIPEMIPLCLLLVLFSGIYTFILFIPVPLGLEGIEDLKFYLIKILGGSSAVYLALSNDKVTNNLERKVCLCTFCISCLLMGLGQDLYNTETAYLFISLWTFESFYAVLIRFICMAYMRFITGHWVLIFLLLLRVYLVHDWDLLMQIGFIYVIGLINLKESRPLRLIFLLMFPYVIILVSSWGPVNHIIIIIEQIVLWYSGHPISIPGIIFSYSGALAVFFLYGAMTGKEHIYTYISYILNGIFLCFFFSNSNASRLLFYLNIAFLLFCTALTSIQTITTHIHEPRNPHFISSFRSSLFFIISTGKHKLAFAYFGLICLLIEFFTPEEWMNTGANSLLFQVGIIEIYRFVFKIVNANGQRMGKEIPMDGIDSKGSRDSKRDDNSTKVKEIAAVSQKANGPVTKSTFNEIKEFESNSGRLGYSTGIRDPPVNKWIKGAKKAFLSTNRKRVSRKDRMLTNDVITACVQNPPRRNDNKRLRGS